jgi:hypothetical protein
LLGRGEGDLLETDWYSILFVDSVLASLVAYERCPNEGVGVGFWVINGISGGREIP